MSDPIRTLEPGTLVAQLIAFILLLLASAFVSGSEVALFSIDDKAKESLRESDDRASERVLTLLNHPRQLLITILIVNTLVNVGAAILAAVMALQVAMQLGLSHTLVLIVEVIVLTFVLLVISEITPKLIATENAIPYSRLAGLPLSAAFHVLGPVTSGLSRLTQLLQNRLKPADQKLSTEDLKVMADVGEAEGTLEEREKELIYSIVEFGSTSVREIMVSRLDMVALPVSATFPEGFELIKTNGHSRIPLYRDHLDNILGIVYAKDLIPFLGKTNQPGLFDWQRIARPAMFVPLGKKLDDLLKDFQMRKTHIAIVVDEYGGTAGLVTLEDVLEEIVGDIRDEHDEDEEMYEVVEENVYRFDGRIDLDDMSKILSLDWETSEFDFETLGGLLYDLLGYIPDAGEKVDYPPLSFTVEAVESNRITRVLVTVQRREEVNLRTDTNRNNHVDKVDHK